MVPSDNGGSGPREESPPYRVVDLTDQEKEILRQLALDSIEHGVSEARPLPVTPGTFPPSLEAPGSVFVTLKIEGQLRGCIGSYQARRPLVEDVAENAFAAAFKDRRFPPLSESELPEVDFHLSLLTAPDPLDAPTREALLESLRPGIDGLLLEDPPHRATFLPQVWETLPEPADFLEELFLKAGLPRNHWSSTLRFHRYAVLEF